MAQQTATDDGRTALVDEFDNLTETQREMAEVADAMGRHERTAFREYMDNHGDEVQG